jgi:hypothetical protein
VRRLLMQHEEERLVLRARLEEPDPEVGGDVGAVALDGQLAPGDEEDRIQIRALAGQDDPAVEARGVGAEVPLANHASVVAALLQMLRHVVPRAIEAIEHRHAVEMRILPGEQRGATGRADGIGDKRILEPHAFPGEAVNVGCLVHLRTVSRDGVLRVVVGKDEEDVGSWLSSECGRSNDAGRGQYCKEEELFHDRVAQ